MSGGRLGIIVYLLLVVIDVKCRVGVSTASTGCQVKKITNRSWELERKSWGEEGEGWDGEQWSVGNCEKENINIAQMLNSYTTDDTDTDGAV